MARGQIAIVLHAHLPYVRHPEYESFLEERWLFEAAIECYLPLLDRLQRLSLESVPYGLTMVITPTLMHMLRDELLCERLDAHLLALERLAEREERRLAHEPELVRLARFYRQRFARVREVWEGCGRDVVGAFAELETRGHLEVMTSAATHGLLPLLSCLPRAVEVQVGVGAGSHVRHLGRAPRGFWLPECGVHPGVDEVLAAHGIRFTVVETHGVLDASVPPRYGVYSPVYTPAAVALFARDPASSRQVWSAETGYPADPAYRDFYRDVGFDLEAERLGALAHADGVRLFTGIKYHRITHHRGLGDKELYSPDDAAARAAEHAEHFLSARTGQVEALAASMDRVPLVVAPYDAELFGHWWFEGPEFLDALLRAVHRARPGMETVTLAEALRSRSTNQVVECASSTWGAGGYNEVWVDGASSWMVRHLVRAANEMVDLARSNPRPSALVRRALDQAARELLLSQSSDWPFIMKTRQAVEFAERHGRLHLCRFFRLARDVEAGTVDPSWLADLEWRDNVFPEIDYEVYA